MAKLKVPSLQHMARNWGETPEFVQKQLVNLALNPPIFNYRALFGAARDLLLFKQPLSEVEAGIRKGTANTKVRENFLEVLPLLHGHFDQVQPQFVQAVSTRFYSAARGLLIPFDQPIIYGIGGQLYFPWLSFWRSNPLSGEKLQLFVSIVREILQQDPDLEAARFEILDFSASPGEGRRLSVIDTADIPDLSNERKKEMLDIFAQGFFQASAELAQRKEAASESEEDASADSRQFSLFDN